MSTIRRYHSSASHDDASRFRRRMRARLRIAQPKQTKVQVPPLEVPVVEAVVTPIRKRKHAKG